MDSLKNEPYFNDPTQTTSQADNLSSRDAFEAFNYANGFNSNNRLLAQNMAQNMHNFHGRPGMITPQDLQGLSGLPNLQGLANFQNTQGNVPNTQPKNNAQAGQRAQQGFPQAGNNLAMSNMNSRGGGSMAQNGVAIPSIQNMPEMPNLQDIQGIPGMPGMPGMPGFGDKFDSQGQLPPEEHNMNYYNEYCRLYIANVVLNTQMNELIDEKNELMNKMVHLEKKAEELQRSQNNYCPLEEKKRRFRRTAQEIDRHYRCPIESCQKSYGSEGSLNQHLKLKHPEYQIPATSSKQGSPAE